MATAKFSLHTKDRKRLIKDRLVRWIVSFGGLSVLAGLIFIFVYLAFVTLPLFSENEVTWRERSQAVNIQSGPELSIVSDGGKHAAYFYRDGTIVEQSLVSGSQTSSQYLGQEVSVQSSDSKTLLIKNDALQWTAINPKFQVDPSSGDAKLLIETPTEKDWFTINEPALIDAVVTKQIKAIASVDNQGFVHLDIRNTATDAAFSSFSSFGPIEDASDIIVTPDAKTIYVKAGNSLAVINREPQALKVREIIDLSTPNGAQATHIQLLSGAYSLLVQYDNQQVWQWFDVLANGERTLTPVRSFQFDADIFALIPETMSKGFAVVLDDGRFQTLYTTSEKLVTESQLPKGELKTFAISNNNDHALLVTGEHNFTAFIPNDHKEISFSALWQKVWYESYPEPEFIWQTTAASDDFEGKYSLVPIAFGTIKAAMFAMLFSVPIAVFGAIYTAYFMSSKMRKVVKPTIELMEALPTVIIGFLAGLWFAPIVETHLPAILLLLVALPLLSLLTGAVWYAIPRAYTSKLPSGLHPFTLIPVIITAIYLAMTFSSDMEVMFFNGDARVFLAQHGIDFDQRNALVVGFAMGFAVIPTIFTIAEDAIFSVPKHLSDGSLALGATQWQTLIYVVLLTASPGIFSAVMMGLGRAVGETMIVLMATGNTPILDWNIFEGMRTLSATMAVELPESEVGSSHYRLLFLIALILFSFTFVVNSLAEWVRQRLREKYSAL
ncbi:ABC transporter permease subunit [Vibrio sp. SCSIO 43140]|uniref:ABC transporter permease subunit n=1 Tax=Vibrio sp. SCSIO 43140 TaxID=2819100 RepID=UPI0020760524|nr:ABC transporter permease subunit [Vibrio sp. SCSIO 43140]USD60982.1 ABC transporter permease subunit [Vibrio sp. SCSIO 43140]